MSNPTAKWWGIGVMILVITIGLVGVALAQTSETPSDPKTDHHKIEPGLTETLSAGQADYIVHFNQQADLVPAYQMGWVERGEFVYNTLRDTAEINQRQAKSILDSLGLNYQTFIAGNELYVWGGNLDSAQSLAALPEVDYIRATQVYHIDPVASEDSSAASDEWANSLLMSYDVPIVSRQESTISQAPTALAWGITDTKADLFWSSFGFQGDSIVVANIDTGVQWDHPALIDSYRCQANPTDPACWLDPSNICGGTICDNDGHGTHTMGTMVAEDDPALPWQAGMAPNAGWIACKGCEYNWCSDFALNTCADWLLAPGGDPANRPHVVNNSWGGGSGDTWYQSKVQNWRAAGIFPAFSAGNSGPGCSSLGSPGDYQESFGSGAHDSGRVIADFSSRGPSFFGHDPYTKPNISAPGVNVCSTVPGNGWNCGYSGTSMASPHTAGAVALLWSCNPGLVGQIDQTFQILQATTDVAPDGNCGAPPDGEGNYTYGYGYLNIYNAGLQWCGDIGTLQGTVTDVSTSIPINLAHISSNPGPFQTTTDAAGFYQMTMLVGDYEITAEAFGYFPQTVPVEVITDTVTLQDFALEPAPASIVSGYISDSATGWPLYASIQIAGYPYGVIWNDPVTGYYQVSLPQGTAYEFTVNAWAPGYLSTNRTIGPFDGDITEDFILNADLDACIAPGYQADLLYYEDLEADNGGFNTYGYGWGGNSWQWGQPSPSPYPYPAPGPGQAHSGINVWGTNLVGNYYDGEDSYIESPDIDLSPYAGSGVKLTWWEWLQTESCCDSATVQVSNDGGASWTDVYGPIYGGIQQWTRQAVTLDASYAVSNFRLRSRLYTDGSVTYPGWYIDDITLEGNCQPQEGGLVVGNVYDTNLGMPLTGAAVSNDSGESTVTTVTADPAVDDSFYTLFSPAGTHDFTASYPGFNTVTEPVDVLLGGTVQHDFYLPAGHLVADPDSLSAELLLGTSETQVLNLINDGDGSAYFEFKERDRGYTPVVQGAVASIKVPGNEVSVGQTAQYASKELVARQPFTYQPSDQALFTLDTTSVLLVSAYEAYQIQAMLLAYPDLSPVDIFDARYDTPDLNLLQSYDSVVIMSNSAFADPVGLGNVLADYVDMGGSVVQTAPTFYDPFGNGWGLRGRFLDEGYSPFLGSGDWFTWSDMGDFDSSHPIMQGVTYAGDYYRQMVELNADAEWVASWTDDEFIATKDQVVALNTFLVDGYSWSGDIPLIVHNSIVWLQMGGDVPWLSVDPITGTLPAESSQFIDIAFDATIIEQPGQYLADLRVNNDTPYGPLIVPVSMNVLAPETWGKLEGTVTGLGYCDADPAPLEEAEVFIEAASGMTWTLQTDANGYYQWWLDEDYSPLTVSVSYPDHESGQATGVVIVGQDTTTIDFDLRWLVACVSADPTELSTELDMGDSTTLQLTLANTGAAGTPFEIKEKDAGYIPVFQGTLAQPQSLVSGDQASAKTTQGLNLPALPKATPLEAGDVLQLWSPFENDFAWGIAYDGDDETVWVGDGWTYENTIFEYLRDGTVTGRSWPYAYGPTSGPADAAFNWNTGMIWIAAVGDGDCIHEIDPSSGETGNVICPSVPMYTFRGLAYDPDTDTYFGGGWNDYTVYHFDSSGNILESAYTGLSISGLAYNPETMHLFVMVNSYDEPVYVLDAANGYQIIGQFYISGWPGYYNGAGLEIDCDGNLWAVAQGNQQVFQFESGETASLCASDVPWLSEDPASGYLEADTGEQVVDVTFDAALVEQPGEHHASLKVKTDDPVNGTIDVPVTMNVIPPETWGKLTGVISSLGYCDENPWPIAEAQIVIESSAGVTWTLQSGDDGYYSWWLDEGLYTVYVTAADHVASDLVTVEVVGQEITTQDISLRWIAPCISGLPISLDVDVPWHFSLGVPFEVINAGAGPADFKLFDRTVKEISVSAGVLAVPQALVAEGQQQAMTTKNLDLPAAPEAAPLDAGEVFQTWSPAQNNAPWGIAFDGDNDAVWVGNGWSFDNTIYEYQPDGTSTGRSHPYNWGPYYGPADSAFNWNTGTLWTLDVGLDNCIHEMDPAGGYTGNTICGPWYISQRGLAYDPATDTWFAGSWNDYTIYHIDSAGNLLDSAYVGLPISGLAYNPDTLHLFVMVNDYTEPVYVLDAANNYQLIGQFSISGWPAYWNGAGLEIDCDGNLWAVAQSQQTVYQFDSGESASLCRSGKDAPWLTEYPQEGTVLADSAFNVELTFTAFPSMTIGTTYTGTLYVKSSDPVSDTFSVPIRLNVIEPQIEVTLAPTATAVSSPPGSTVQYLVSVTNNGNVPDTYDLSLQGDDWPTLMLTPQISLDPGESTEIPIFVFIPASAEDGEIDEMSLMVESNSDEVMGWEVSATANLSTRAFYTRVVRLTPATASRIGDVGEVLEYTLTLWNLSLISDTIDLHGEAGWEIHMSETSFSLDSFESAEVTVQVHIPWGVSPGEMDIAIITAVSQSEPKAWDETKLTTYAEEMYLFLPIIAKEP